MQSSDERRLAEIRRGILKTQFIGVPAALLLGLGLYGLFAVNGDAFHPLLNDRDIALGLLGAGIVFEIFQMVLLVPLLKEQASLVRRREQS